MLVCSYRCILSFGNDRTQDRGEDEEEESDSEESSDEFFKLKKSSNPSTHISKEDTTRSQGAGKNVENDIDFDELRDKFVTGNWGTLLFLLSITFSYIMLTQRID